MTYFCPALDPSLDRSGRNTRIPVRDLHPYHVSSKSIKRFWRKSWKCECLRTTDDDRRTDGQTSDGALWQYNVAYLSLRLRWAKSNKISSFINLQNYTDVISRYGSNCNTHHVWCDKHAPAKFIYRSYRYTYWHVLHWDLIQSIVTLEIWSSGKDGRLVTWRPYRLGLKL